MTRIWTAAIIATAIGGFVFCAAAWDLYGFVTLKFGGPPPCEVSNTCNWK